MPAEYPDENEEEDESSPPDRKMIFLRIWEAEVEMWHTLGGIWNMEVGMKHQPLKYGICDINFMITIKALALLCSNIYTAGMYTFRVIIEPDKPSGYHGFVPLLKGLHTQGETLTEVKRNLREAIICHLQGLLKDKEDIPQESEAFEIIESISQKELSVSR